MAAGKCRARVGIPSWEGSDDGWSTFLNSSMGHMSCRVNPLCLYTCVCEARGRMEVFEVKAHVHVEKNRIKASPLRKRNVIIYLDFQLPTYL